MSNFEDIADYENIHLVFRWRICTQKCRIFD